MKPFPICLNGGFYTGDWIVLIKKPYYAVQFQFENKLETNWTTGFSLDLAYFNNSGLFLDIKIQEWCIDEVRVEWDVIL